MGLNSAEKIQKPSKTSIPVLDDSGQLSIDFIVGFTIFMITLILAITMTSGLLVGLQSKKIDYDAVAYRTGVVLVEDPGEPTTIINYPTITEQDEWERIGYDQRDLVKRFGLTAYKSTPRILTVQKVLGFFNPSMWPNLNDYEKRMIFSNYPYHFNVTLKVQGEPPLYVGEPYSINSNYGYIRRIVLVKEESNTDDGAVGGIDSYLYREADPISDPTGEFNVRLDYDTLLNKDWGPTYWIEPPKEDIVINLANVSEIKNDLDSTVTDSTLNTIRIVYYGRLLSGGDATGDLPLPVTAIIDGSSHTFPYPDPFPIEVPVNRTVNITFPAGFFIPPSAYAHIQLISMNISFRFNESTVHLAKHNNVYEYNFGSQGFMAPTLKTGILEVRVW